MNKIKNTLSWAVAAGAALVPGSVFAAAATPWDAGYANAQGSGVPSGSITGIISNTMAWLLGLLGFVGIIGFVIAGILYLTAAGDEDQIDRAKTAMRYSIIGIVVGLIGFVVIQAVDTWLMGASSTF